MGKMIENYSLQNEIGRGVYSTVYRAINIKTKQEVAIKMVKAEKFKQYPKLQEGTYNQINILTTLESCPHIIKYYDMLKTVNNFYFVYEYCNGGTLEKLLKERGTLPEKTALNYFSQIVDAFKILNKHNIMHRDLKPQNLLIHDGILKLADFGFCKPLENQDQISNTMIGSPIYMAPQVLKGEEYTIKTDIWSLGVVLFRMLFGYCPFDSKNIGKLIMMIEEAELHIPREPKVSPQVIKLIKRMITKNPVLRCDWSEVFSYEVINGELLRTHGLRDKTPKGGMRKSLTITQTTNSSGLIQNKEGTSSRRFQHQHEGSNLMYNPRKPAINNELRSTYTTKSPFRENFRKDLMMKNHLKCIDIMSLALGLMQYSQKEALALAYYITKNVEKQLTSINESALKELENKGDETFMKTFASSLETQQKEVKNLILQLRDQLRSLNISVEIIQIKRKQLLKRLVEELNRQRFEDLVCISRVVDYITQELVIRKETYEKMSQEKMLSNIKLKMEGL